MTDREQLAAIRDYSGLPANNQSTHCTADHVKILLAHIDALEKAMDGADNLLLLTWHAMRTEETEFIESLDSRRNNRKVIDRVRGNMKKAKGSE